MRIKISAEDKRIADNTSQGLLETVGTIPERASWGTVREDYSSDGEAWDYFPFDHSRSRVYRWGEDGLGGISDINQNLCFALASGTGKTLS